MHEADGRSVERAGHVSLDGTGSGEVLSVQEGQPVVRPSVQPVLLPDLGELVATEGAIEDAGEEVGASALASNGLLELDAATLVDDALDDRVGAIPHALHPDEDRVGGDPLVLGQGHHLVAQPCDDRAMRTADDLHWHSLIGPSACADVFFLQQLR